MREKAVLVEAEVASAREIAVFVEAQVAFSWNDLVFSGFLEFSRSSRSASDQGSVAFSRFLGSAEAEVACT